MATNTPIYEGAYLPLAPPCAAKLEQFFKQVNPSQEVLLRGQAKEFLIGGGFGAGKTVAALIKGIMLCQYYPGTTGFVARETYPQLKDTVIDEWKNWCPDEWARYVKTDGPGGTSYFHNGSKVFFRHFDKFSEKEIKSLNLGWAFVDQGEDVPEATYLALLGRLRQRTLPKTMVWITANPRPGWIKRRFIDPWQAGELDENKMVVNVPTEENAHNLPDDYIPTLEQNYSEVWLNRYVKARWDAFEGLVYPDFSRNRHVVKAKDFTLDPTWPMTMLMDYGLRNPVHANAYAVTPYDHHFHVAEYRANDLSVAEYSTGIKKTMGPFFPFSYGMWADPSIKRKDEKERPTIQEMFMNEGLPFSLANNDFQSGWTMVTRWLKQDRLKILDTCIHTIQEFEEWEWEDWTHLEEKNLKEVPKDRNNHSMDDYTYYANLHPETHSKKKHLRPQSIKEIIEAEDVPRIDPEVVRKTRDQEARDWFKAKHRRRVVY